jgi:hypothetical protein
MALILTEKENVPPSGTLLVFVYFTCQKIHNNYEYLSK